MAMTDYAEIVLQAGLFHDEITLEAIYELATKIIHDSVISEKRLAKVESSILALGATAVVLREMTPEERADLRERVAAVTKISARNAS